MCCARDFPTRWLSQWEQRTTRTYVADAEPPLAIYVVRVSRRYMEAWCPTATGRWREMDLRWISPLTLATSIAPWGHGLGGERAHRELVEAVRRHAEQVASPSAGQPRSPPYFGGGLLAAATRLELAGHVARRKPRLLSEDALRGIEGQSLWSDKEHGERTAGSLRSTQIFRRLGQEAMQVARRSCPLSMTPIKGVEPASQCVPNAPRRTPHTHSLAGTHASGQPTTIPKVNNLSEDREESRTPNSPTSSTDGLLSNDAKRPHASIDRSMP